MRLDRLKLNYYNLSQYILAFFCLTAISGGLVYRVYALNWLGVGLSLLLLLVSGLSLAYLAKKFNLTLAPAAEAVVTLSTYNLPLVAIYLLLEVIGFFVLFNSSTVTSIISPWQVVPNYFFIVYLLATGCLLFLLVRRVKCPLFYIILHYFLALSVVWLVYRIGYGYDFFIHQATLELIDKQGLVLPKPNYYLGQYGLIIIFHKLFGFSILWLNRLLVPVLAAFFLPLAIYPLVKKPQSCLAVLIPLVLPFAFLTFSTPQNLAYLFLLLAIIYSLNLASRFNYLLIFLLAGAALLIQPIAGLPAIFFLAYLIISRAVNFKFRKVLTALILGMNAFSLPLAFYFLEKNNLTLGRFSWNNLFSWPSFSLAGQENVILNFIYLYEFNFKIIFSILVLIGLLIYFKKRTELLNYRPFIIFSPTLFLAYFLIKLLPFNFLIDYERGDYAARVLLIASLFLLPFAWLTLNELIDRVAIRNNFARLSWFIFAGLLITTALYLSYPRIDHYYNSRGYSTGGADLAAVKWIEQTSHSDYIVLADQQVSAAALYQFGFAKYYNNYFYYPVPTSGPLYQLYLDMVYKNPDRATMNKALELTRVKTGYFVLNKYWWAFAKILAEAKYSADSWQSFDNGQVYVFEYKLQ